MRLFVSVQTMTTDGVVGATATDTVVPFASVNLTDPIDLTITGALLRQCGFRSDPYPHQLEGVQWLLMQEGSTMTERVRDNRSAILADEMGLGKTPQTIALCMVSMFLDHALFVVRQAAAAIDPAVPIIPSHCAWSRPTLIVVPKPLLLQWQEEILKHTDSLTINDIHVYHGTARTLTNYPSHVRTPLQRARYTASVLFGKKRFVITTYETVVNDMLQKDHAFGDYLNLKKGKRKARKRVKTVGGNGVDGGGGDDGVDGDVPPLSDDFGELPSWYDLDNGHGHPPSNETWSEEFLALRGPLFQLRWNRIVLDEGQRIRNLKSNVARAVINLRAQRRTLLSGTVFNNSNLDLCTMCIFLRLPVYNMPSWWSRLINKHAEVAAWRERHVLRRLKVILKSILQPKIEKWTNCYMSSIQQRIYDDLLKKSQVDLMSLHAAKGVQRLKVYQHLLNWMQKLRQCCNDPLLLHGREVTLPFSRLSQRSMDNNRSICCNCVEDTFAPEFVRLQCGHALCGVCSGLDDLPECRFCRRQSSPKTVAVVQFVLQRLREDPTHQTVVVSQWASYLDVLEYALREANITHSRYDGDISSMIDRNRIVHRFQGVPDQTTGIVAPRPAVLLLSLTAGGLGLNLTAGSMVILTDMWFNPFVEEQAIDRCHRIGQSKSVVVRHLRMIPSKDSTAKYLIEYYMSVLQYNKKRAGNYYLDEDLSELTEDAVTPTRDDLHGIFTHLIDERNGGVDQDADEADEADEVDEVDEVDMGDLEHERILQHAVNVRHPTTGIDSTDSDCSDSEAVVAASSAAAPASHRRKRIREDSDED